MSDREILRRLFNDRSPAELPAEAKTPDSVWLMVEKGWTIWTRFDTSAEDGREYLEYYASHRMHGNRHTRLFADGTEDDLEIISEFCTYSKDATEEEKEEARREQREYNLSVLKNSGKKGALS